MTRIIMVGCGGKMGQVISGIVEADERRQLRHALAQRARHGHRLLARIHVDHRLAARCDEACQIGFAVA